MAVIDPLTVHPSAEGGVGRMLMYAALPQARKQNHDQIRLVQSPSHIRVNILLLDALLYAIHTHRRFLTIYSLLCVLFLTMAGSGHVLALSSQPQPQPQLQKLSSISTSSPSLQTIQESSAQQGIHGVVMPQEQSQQQQKQEQSSSSTSSASGGSTTTTTTSSTTTATTGTYY